MRSVARFAFALVLASFATAGTACSRPAPESTPEGVVRLWLDRMEASSEDARAAHEAYALLGPKARASLEERADLASKMQGRRVDPEKMLAQGRFGLKFRPKTMTAQVNGDDAVVAVSGTNQLVEHTTVHCVRESGQWKIEPELPAVAPLRRRNDDAGFGP